MWAIAGTQWVSYIDNVCHMKVVSVKSFVEWLWSNYSSEVSLTGAYATTMIVVFGLCMHKEVAISPVASERPCDLICSHTHNSHRTQLH